MERTEAGESAPSRHEDSPRPGRTKCELYETLQDLIMGAGKEASINLPCLLILASSWTASPSHSYSSELQAKGGHCAARPSCLSDGVRDREERITWSCATKRPVSGLLRAASPTIFLGAGEVRRAGIEGSETRREISGLPGPSSAKFGFRGGRMLHNSDKEFTLTMGGGCGMLEGGRHGAGVVVQGAGERERSFTDNIPKRTHKNL